MLKKEMYSSRSINPIVQNPSIDIGGLKRNVSLGLLSLKTNVSSAFL